MHLLPASGDPAGISLLRGIQPGSRQLPLLIIYSGRERGRQRKRALDGAGAVEARKTGPGDRVSKGFREALLWVEGTIWCQDLERQPGCRVWGPSQHLVWPDSDTSGEDWG